MKTSNLLRGALFAALFLPLFGTALTSCSVVFTASITGRLIDKTAYEDNAEIIGIDDADVYLYTDKTVMEADVENWDEEAGSPPLTDDGEYAYFVKTVSQTSNGEAGSFTISGIVWNELFPSYGKTADRKEVYFVYYHEDYGITTDSTYIVSDVTNRLAPAKLEKALNDATVRGTVLNLSTGDGEEGVTVDIYVPDSWTYDGEDITDADYPRTSTYTVLTDADGVYEADITYPMTPSKDDNQGTTLLLLTFDKDSFTADSAFDADIREDRDIDLDDENDAYYQSPVIDPDKVTTMAEIAIKRTELSASLEGTLYDNGAAAYKNGAEVRLYLNRGAAPGAAALPDYTTATKKQVYGTESPTFQDGYFSFDTLEWTDTAYTGRYSIVTCYIDVDVDRDGTIEAGEVNNLQFTLTSDTDNFLEITYTP